MIGGSNSPSAGGFENLYSLAFDGINDFVTIPNLTGYTGSIAGWSISFWLKTTASNKPIITKNSTTNKEWLVQIDKTNPYPFIVLYGNNDTLIFQKLILNVDVADGNWHNIIFTFANTAHHSGLNAYVDGVAYSDSIGNATYSNTGVWAPMGNTAQPVLFASMDTSFTACNLDEISLYDAPIGATAAAEIYNSGSPTDILSVSLPVGVNLKGWWRNGDTAGTSVYPTIEDYSSFANQGTMTNMTSGDIVTDVP